MNDSMPSLNTPNKIQWNSPLLILGLFLASFVLGAGTFMLLTGKPRPMNRQISPEGIIISPIGTPVDGQKTTESINRLLSDEKENEFLTFSYLRNTYSGGLLEVIDDTAAAVEDSDVALTLEVSKGDLIESLFFSITKAELGKLKVFSVGQNGTGPITYQELERGDSVSITRITDFATDQNDPDEIIIEATKLSL